MCRFKSGIILKDRIYIPDHDRHTNMLNELGIEDTRENAERVFVRAELIPPNNDFFAPVSEWTLNVDQDILPDWFVKEYEEKRMREGMQSWAEAHIHVGKSNLIITEGMHLLKNSTVTAYDQSVVRAYDRSVVTAYDRSVVTAYDQSVVRAYGQSMVRAYGQSTVKACDQSTVEAYDQSTVEAYDQSVVEAYDQSMVKAYGQSTVEAYDQSMVIIHSSSSFDVNRLMLFKDAVALDRRRKQVYCSKQWSLKKTEGNKNGMQS